MRNIDKNKDEAGLVLLIYGLPLLVMYFLPFTRKLYSTNSLDIISLFLIIYCVYLLFKKNEVGKEAEISRTHQVHTGLKKLFNFVFKKGLKGEMGVTHNERVSLLFYCVKIFFTPLMIHFTIGNLHSLQNFFTHSPSWQFTLQNIVNNYYRFIFYIILFIDTTIFTVGYLIESKKLKNIVKSVEPTALGWIVALACYPPFNDITGKIFGWYSSDFATFSNLKLNLVFGFISLALFSIYLWASIALGWKASNLTNRGIISTGPYKYVRHPAYIAKNLSWWVMGIPFILKFGLIAIFSLTIWSFIYYLRAMTEERHLSADPDYIEYMQKVKWKFIPKVF